MRKPIIGITMNYESKTDTMRFPTYENFEYNHNRWAELILDNGGTAIYLTSLSPVNDIGEIIGFVDGILLSGGTDVDPSLYGERRKPYSKTPTLIRDRYEIELVKQAVKSKIPVLGICRGIQLINVAFGGSLYQDISAAGFKQIEHRNTEKKDYLNFHYINLESDSYLYGILSKKRIKVNTSHHQAVARLGENLRATALADDSIIEGIEYTGDSYLIGVQWHPEAMPDYDSTKSLTKDFIEICRKR